MKKLHLTTLFLLLALAVSANAMLTRSKPVAAEGEHQVWLPYIGGGDDIVGRPIPTATPLPTNTPTPVPGNTPTPVPTTPPPTGPVYYVATDGNDGSGNGSANKPWKTINHAFDKVPAGATILVRPGTYTGRIEITRRFSEPVTLRSEIDYQAKLRNNHQVLICFECRNVIIEGFDMAHNGPGADRYVVQIQDTTSNGTGGRDVIIRNNVMHDSYNNDILKINSGAQDIIVENNMFYNQTGQDSHIDVTSGKNIFIQDNIFFNNYAASQREDLGNTGSFLLIKDADGDADGIVGSQYITVRRNVFFNWSGDEGNSFIALGDNRDANYYHAREITIENNLMVGNKGKFIIHTALKVTGSREITFRNNTVVGDMPSKTFAFRLNTGNLHNKNIEFYNNIWADPTGTMGADRPEDPNVFGRTEDTDSYKLSNNLYWNGTAELPHTEGEKINIRDDSARIHADPQLNYDHGHIQTPHWRGDLDRFADGSLSIREAFVSLVVTYGSIPNNSPAVNAANGAFAPDTDILGNPRNNPDVGAFEYRP